LSMARGARTCAIGEGDDVSVESVLAAVLPVTKR
jgi:hypothetical protein